MSPSPLPPSQRPRRRVFGLPGDRAEDRAAAARLLRAQGFDAITVGVDTPPERLEPVLEAGLAVWGCRAAFSVRGLSEETTAPLLARDTDGQPQRWFGSGCPNDPALRQAHLGAIGGLARSGAFAGFMLDGIRFASPHAGAGFFTCFCARCSTKAMAFGFDVSRMRSAVAALRALPAQATGPFARTPSQLVACMRERSGLAEWLRFRAACVAEHVQEVRATVDGLATTLGRRFGLGAYLFTPSFAPLVGQDYAALAPLLDVVCPMIYRSLEGDATLGAEWSSLARARLLPDRGPFAPVDGAAEVAAARALLPSDGPPLVPILQLADEMVGEVTRAALAAGADGLDYFSFRPGYEHYVVAAGGA